MSFCLVGRPRAARVYRQAGGCPQCVSQTSVHVNTVSATKTDSPAGFKGSLGHKLRYAEAQGLKYSLAWMDNPLSTV